MTIIQPKLLKGTREFLPQQMAKRDLVMSKIRRVFQKFGYDTIETPILNPAKTILGKYGEEGDKLTYWFDARGTDIALPYDQTVPFAKLVAANWRDLPMPFKRYQVSRVWRAEKPQKGRLREFYQCDIDIIGTRSLVAEAEVMKVMVECLKAVGFEDFTVNFNSRRLINSVLERFEVKQDPTMVIRVIDKLDKVGEEKVVEMLKLKGVEKAEELMKVLNGGEFSDFDLSEIDEFQKYCVALGVNQKYMTFDATLARGLDYYTGIIYEAVDNSGYGSLAGGGRYDDLCGKFCDQDFSGVGVALGFERIMLALEEKGLLGDVRLASEFLVAVFDESSMESALNLYNDLSAAGINGEVYFSADKLKKQFKYADKKAIPFVLIEGPDEAAKGEVLVKVMNSGQQKSLPKAQLVSYLKNYYEG